MQPPTSSGTAGSPAFTGRLRIGTRGSRLALAQAHEVKARLLAAHAGLAEDDVEIVVMSTKGDRILDRALAEIGGKGLFTEEIEAALLAGEIDLAVHSLKDMPTELPPGLTLAAVLEREDPRDVFISRTAATIQDLRAGAVVGTASLRRQAQVKALRPDLKVVTFRGNVETRLRKLAAGEVDATLLALAGLKRLGLEAEATAVLSTDIMLPAVAQGAITIETRAEDPRVMAAIMPLNHHATEIAVTAERGLLAALDGSCRTPIAAIAEISADGREVRILGKLLRPDGSQCFSASENGPVDDARAIGRRAGERLRAAAGPDFFAELINPGTAV